MKEGWEIKELREIGNIFNGNSINAKVKKEKYLNREEEGIPYIATKDVSYNSIIEYNNGISIPFNEKRDFKVAQKDTILICAEGGSAGRKIGFTNKEICFGNKLFAFSANEKNDSKYVYYFYFSNKFQKDFHSQMTGIIGGVSMNKFKNLEIPLPPLKEQQQQIVALLDKAFTAIEKAKTNAQQNLLNAKELFESYLQNVFVNGKLKVENGEWVEKTLGEVCNKIQDGAHHSPKVLYPNKENGLFPYVTSKNIRNNYMDLSKLQFVDETFHLTIYPRCKPEMGDVLLTKDGAKTGNVTLNTLDEPFSLLSSVCLIKTNKIALEPEFLKFYIQSPMGFKSITGKMTGAAIKRIILRAIKSAIIPLPPIKEQQKITKKLNALQTQTKKLEAIYQQKITDLEELKKSVLQKAFNGELTASSIKTTVNNTIAVIPNISTTDLHAGIIAIAFQSHIEKNKENTFHHVKSEKIIHLAETFVGIHLNRNPVKDAAGPNDFPLAKKVESRARKAGFFTVSKQNGKFVYQQGSQFNKLIAKVRLALNEKNEPLMNLIDLMVPMTTQQAEILATVYAAWNNLIIDNKIINDEAIVLEARENWHKEKLNISREKFFNAITWMKSKGVIPNGNGKKIIAKAVV